MNCEKAVKQIYLLSEITKEERDQVMEHIQSCKSCQELFAAVTSMQQVIQNASDFTAQLSTPAHLTHQIMSSLQSPPKRPAIVSEMIGRFLGSWSIRWSMTMASLVLIGWGGVEQQTWGVSHPTESALISKTSDRPVLKMSDFHEALKKYKTEESARLVMSAKNIFGMPAGKTNHFRERFKRNKII